MQSLPQVLLDPSLTKAKSREWKEMRQELDRAGTLKVYAASFPCMHGSWTGIVIGMVKSVVFLAGFGPEGSSPSPVQQDRLDEDSCYQV